MSKIKIIILTGNELRHSFFRKLLSQNKNIEVLNSYCEGKELSLFNRINSDPQSTEFLRNHVKLREISELDFFETFNKYCIDKSRPIFISKGEINNKDIVSEINMQNPDLLICYGSSLIKSNLIEKFKNKFLNVHLGLSPYYRGSGTNIWPIINNEPELIGATFMHIDKGIDTGRIIHQIRADIYHGDTPHSIGNRLIKQMCNVYVKIINNFSILEDLEQPSCKSGKVYNRKDFDNEACIKLYDNLSNNLVSNYLSNKKRRDEKFALLQNPSLESCL